MRGGAPGDDCNGIHEVMGSIPISSTNSSNAAGVLLPPELRSLDAIHLATARELGGELGALVTYDDSMVAAAKRLGYRIVQPS